MFLDMSTQISCSVLWLWALHKLVLFSLLKNWLDRYCWDLNMFHIFSSGLFRFSVIILKLDLSCLYYVFRGGRGNYKRGFMWWIIYLHMTLILDIITVVNRIWSATYGWHVGRGCSWRLNHTSCQAARESTASPQAMDIYCSSKTGFAILNNAYMWILCVCGWELEHATSTKGISPCEEIYWAC